MNIKKLFINLIVILFVGVIVLSVVTVVKRKNEPKEEFVLPNTNIAANVENLSMDTEAVMETEITEATEVTETSESVEDNESDEPQSMYVLGSVNVRSGPGIENRAIGSLALNTEVTAIGPLENGWQKIIYRNLEGYVSAEYLSETPIGAESEQTQPTAPEETPESTPTNPETTP